VVWLPDSGDAAQDTGTADEAADATATPNTSLPPYDSAYYQALLQRVYVARLSKCFTPATFAQLFRPGGQAGLWDSPVAAMQPAWIPAPGAPTP
jgi:hypothetical protein